MPYALMIPPRIQFIGSNGSPLAGGKVYTYSPGTTTAKATYTTSAGGTENANPVVLDAAGRAAIWLNGIYKISVYDSSDVLQYTVDNVSAIYGDCTSTSAELSTLHSSGITNADLVKVHAITLTAAQINNIWLSRFGYVKRATFGVTDADTITIGPGAYHHSGTTDQFVYWSSTLTKDVTVTGTQWYYLYIDDSAVVTLGTNLLTAAEFTLVTDAPTWSAAKQGYYNGSDRCIMALRVTSNNLDTIYHDGGDLVQYQASKYDFSAADISARTAVTLTIPAFARKAWIHPKYQMNAAEHVYIAPADVDGLNIGIGVAATYVGNDIYTITSADQKVYIAMSDYTGTNNLAVHTNGWFFPVGM